MRTLDPAGLLLSALALAAPSAAQYPVIERPIPYPLPESAAWKRAVEAGTRTTTGKSGAAYWTNYAHYDIAAELDPETAVVPRRSGPTR